MTFGLLLIISQESTSTEVLSYIQFESFVIPLALRATPSPSSTFTHPIFLSITKEALVEYFQSPASSTLVILNGSPINDHFSHVEQFILGDVPSDLVVLKLVQVSFAKLAQAPIVFEISCQLLNHINMAIEDMIFNHNMNQH